MYHNALHADSPVVVKAVQCTKLSNRASKTSSIRLICRLKQKPTNSLDMQSKCGLFYKWNKKTWTAPCSFFKEQKKKKRKKRSGWQENLANKQRKTRFFKCRQCPFNWAPTALSSGSLDSLAHTAWRSSTTRLHTSSYISECRAEHLPIFICLEKVYCFKFLGSDISDNLSWSINITAAVKRAATALLVSPKEKQLVWKAAGGLFPLDHSKHRNIPPHSVVCGLFSN